jgi:hypothetical protein
MRADLTEPVEWFLPHLSFVESAFLMYVLENSIFSPPFRPNLDGELCMP